MNAWDDDVWNKRREKLDEIADFFDEQMRLLALAQKAAFEENEDDLAVYLTELQDLPEPSPIDWDLDRKERVWN